MLSNDGYFLTSPSTAPPARLAVLSTETSARRGAPPICEGRRPFPRIKRGREGTPGPSPATRTSEVRHPFEGPRSVDSTSDLLRRSSFRAQFSIAKFTSLLFFFFLFLDKSKTKLLHFQSPRARSINVRRSVRCRHVRRRTALVAHPRRDDVARSMW